MTETTPNLPPLVTMTAAAEFLGINRTALWRKINAGELDIVSTAPRKRWIPARCLAPFPWTGGSLTRHELADVLGVSYSAVVRAVARNVIPVGPDQRVVGSWIARMCDPTMQAEFESVTFDEFELA